MMISSAWTRMVVFLQGLFFVWLGIAPGCATGGPGEPPAAQAPRPLDVLRVGVSETAPPLIFEQDGEPVGLEADFARQLAQDLGKDLRLVSVFWPNLISELTSHRFDIIMSGMSITDERRRQVAFAEPYLQTGQQALIRREDQATLGTTEAILATDRTVGVEVRSTGLWFAYSRMEKARKIRFRTLERAVEALMNGEVDTVIHDSPCVQWGWDIMAIDSLRCRGC